MFLKNLKIKNFRNIEEANISFGEKINIILGNNAQGKTNIVESIYVTAFLKSFRTQKINDLIKDGCENFSINIDLFDNDVLNKIDFFMDKTSKKLNINGKKPENYKYLNVVIFHPDEVNYITNYPVFRRNLIDRSIFYTDFDYINLYKKYYRCLKQRNILLKENKDIYDCWKDQLIDYGSEIIRKRIDYIEKINSFFYKELFKKNNYEKYFLKYSRDFKKISIEDYLKDELKRKEERERQLGYTLVGPHKDDIIFYLNDRPADKFASQGQKRSMVISYKTAQILDYKSVQGHYPVLILDDMTSELDVNRRNILLENLLENSGQVFITSTDLKKTTKFDQSRVFKVNNGEISLAD